MPQEKTNEGKIKDHVYKLIELTGTSTASMEGAINNALHRAGASVKNLRWFQMNEIRGDIDQNKAFPDKCDGFLPWMED